MGQEATCVVEFNGRRSEGKALLETDEIVFRGDFRLKLHRKEITRLSGESGVLTAHTPDGIAVFYLGPQSAKWAAKFLNPPGRLQKLGIQAGVSYCCVGEVEPGFVQELKEAGAVESKDAEVTFLGASEIADLQALSESRCPTMWVIYPKGVKSITEGHVLEAGRNAGRVDIKVASFSKTHTALKFVARAGKDR